MVALQRCLFLFLYLKCIYLSFLFSFTHFVLFLVVLWGTKCLYRSVKEKSFCSACFHLKVINCSYYKWTHLAHLLKVKKAALQAYLHRSLHWHLQQRLFFFGLTQTGLSEGAARHEELRETPHMHALKSNTASGSDEFIHAKTRQKSEGM